MTYEEFCSGIGMKVDRKCFERIEAVYMAFDRFETKAAICDFYKKYDMNGVEKLYTELHKYNELCAQRESINSKILDTAMLCGIS